MRFRTLLTVAACAFFTLVCALCRVGNATKLRDFQGERTFYLNSASSQSLVKKTLALSDISKLKGESVTMQTTLTGQEKTAFVEKVLEKYDAYIIMEEACGETVSYYCYSPNLGKSVLLGGSAVNLHIAIAPSRVALGVPLIFGGF